MLRSIIENSVFQWSLGGLCILYILFLQFYNIHELNIIQWDESRLAINTAEMYQNGNFLVPTFNKQPDLYNTKPHLLIWLQVISTFIFGLNEFSLRLPSALAGLLCIFLCAYIVYKKTHSLYPSIFTALLLATSGGFIQLHGSLTGDYDALLSLFVLLSIYQFYCYLYKHSLPALARFTLFLSLAILCKSAAGLLVLPVVLACIGLKPKLKTFIQTGIAIIIACIPFTIYVLIRNEFNEGYIDAIIQNDFLGRFNNALEGHHSKWYYYIVNLFDYRYSYWIFCLPIALVFAFIKGKNTLKFYSLATIVYLVFLSIAQTRIHWYDMPVLPLISIVIALFAWSVYELIPDKKYQNVYILLICLLMIFPIKEKFEFIAFRKNINLDFTHYELSTMMRNYKINEHAVYLAAPYDPEFYFYSLQNPTIQKGSIQHLHKNTIVFHGNLFKDSLDKTYIFRTLDSTENARRILILGTRKPIEDKKIGR